MRLLFLQAVGLLLLASLASAFNNPLIRLDYGDFQGKYDATYNLSYFRKIPYASPPTGTNRFRAPQPPQRVSNGIYNTDQDFDMCPQRTVNGSEDCLYLGLFSRPWDTKSAVRRPVLVVFYGGAFIQGSASFTLPPSSYPVLNVSNLNDYVVIYPNYRVNAFGFLPGKAIKDSPTSDLNPGLLDQQFVLKWVQSHIHHFGGDPRNVTIWGQSAGGGSVVAQVLANGRHGNPKLFSKALVSSPFWPKTYRYDDPQAEAIYAQLVTLTGCASAPDSLSCLKSVDVQSIRDASLVISASNQWTTSSYTWAPVIDGSFLVDTLSHSVADDSSSSLATNSIYSIYNTHEGENFLPPSLSQSDSQYNTTVFSSWLNGFLPGLKPQDIRKIETKYYPPTGSSETLTTYNSTLVRAGLVYRDVVLACPAYWIASGAREKGYLAEYTIEPAKHASDTIWWNRINPIQQSNPLVYTGYAGSFASFIQTGDPNAHKLTGAEVPGVPSLNAGSKPESKATAEKKKKEQEEFVVRETGFENVGLWELRERCAFWKEVGGRVPV